MRPLTERQRQIVAMSLGGRRDKEIADALKLSLQTVKNHWANMYLRYDVTGRMGLLGKLIGADALSM